MSTSSTFARRAISGIISSSILSSRLVKTKSKDFLMAIMITSMSGNKMDVAEKDLISQSDTKQAS